MGKYTPPPLLKVENYKATKRYPWRKLIERFSMHDQQIISDPVMSGAGLQQKKSMSMAQRIRKPLIGLAAVLFIVFAGYASIRFMNAQSLHGAKKVPTTILDGKKIPAPVYTGQSSVDKDRNMADFKKDISELEAKIAQGAPSYENYLALAQTYFQDGNKAKAIENYEKAKKAADPKMPYYKEFITSTDDLIKQLKTTQ